jgi:hypothetical protein
MFLRIPEDDVHESPCSTPCGEMDAAGCADDTYTSELIFPRSDDDNRLRLQPTAEVLEAQHLVRLSVLRAKYAATRAGKRRQSK